MIDFVKKISDLEQQLEEKSVELEMATMLLKNEMEVRSSFEVDLQESEEKFRTIAEITPLGMILVNQNNSIAYLNPQVTRSLGYTLKDLPDIPSALTLLFPNISDREVTWKKLQNRKSSIRTQDGESSPEVYQMSAKDGTLKTLELFFAPYGQVMLILLHDITERKKAEEALYESDRRYREMIEKIPIIAVILDREGKITFGNEYLLKVTGWKREEISGIDWFSTFTLPEDNVREVFLKSIRDVDLPPQMEYYICSKDRTIHSMLWTNLTLKDTEGMTSGVVSLGIDITERQQREKAIQLANKKLNILSSISRHDIANELTELFLNLELVQDTIEESGSLELIMRSLEVIRDIRQQIEFTRFYQDIGVHAPEWYDLTQTIQDAVRSFPSSSIHFEIITDNIFIYADPLIQKVFFNLIDNSIRHGGNVTRISFTVHSDGSTIEIRYADDGVGVPLELKDRIFERGFGKHTGMGLFLIREILTITGIEIREVGMDGSGVEFLVTIPKGNWRENRNV